MSQVDARSLKPEKQFKRRMEFIKLRERGISNLEASIKAGISPTRGSTIWRNYKEFGLSAIESKKRGRKKGKILKLTQEDELEIYDIILHSTPDQFELGFLLWSKSAIRSLLDEKYNIDLPLRTLADYLKRWGIITPRPEKSAPSNNPRLKAWFEESYPILLKEAQKGKIEIHWCFFDVKSMANSKSSIYMIASKTNQGKFRFQLYEEELSNRTFNLFIRKLLAECNRDIYLIFYGKEEFVYKSMRKGTKKAELIYLE